ncbi:hypothetical protein D3C85_1183880 [compost metagenome]
MALVEAQLERGGGAHQADPAAGQAQAAQVFDDGLDDVQHGQRRGRRDLVKPQMGGIAGNGDDARARLFQEAHAFHHVGQGVLAAGHIGAGPVGNAGIIAQQRGDVMLVDRGGRQRRQAEGKGRAGHGTHPAQYTQVAVLGKRLHFMDSENASPGVSTWPGRSAPVRSPSQTRLPLTHTAWIPWLA